LTLAWKLRFARDDNLNLFSFRLQQAQKTIAKKQSKVDEIEKIVKEEMTPTLEKLRKEKALYMQFASNQTELERLSKSVIIDL